ncbi:MAG TPA: N-glycosylase/DNA lyase [Candidatus Paceibacterota bacterium]|nr:N-glycosylase/DNA lyase [Candidatus Paceibacterota bacterium]
MWLKSEIERLKQTSVKELIDKRLESFSSFADKQNEYWFSELCFCILTANSRADSAMRIQSQVSPMGFLMSPEANIARAIKTNKHRFHNNKAKYICEARTYKNIREIVSGMNEVEAREWLVENIKGLGYKEASHFLRNTGSKNLAILDRHILNLMAENGIITRPKSLNKKSYLEIEEKFNSLAQELGMSSAELDLYMWFMKTGVVLK